MLALEVPARLTWSVPLVIASVILGLVWAAAALYVASQPVGKGRTLLAATLLTVAIVTMHLTAMGAVQFVPDPTRAPASLLFSPDALALVLAGAAAIILGMCFVAAFGDRRTDDKLKRQKLLLDAALTNMSQGLCMFDASGGIILFNDRYAQLTRSQVGRELKLAETSALATRLIETISAPFTIHGYQILIGATLGISVASDDGADPDQLLEKRRPGALSRQG